MFVARTGENEFITDINHLKGLVHLECGPEKYANKKQNTVKNRIKGENTNSYGFRLENALLHIRRRCYSHSTL